MAACGEITPMPDAAIFGDTQDEPEKVYRWLAWLKTQLPYPVIEATAGDLMQITLQQRRSQKTGRLYTKNLIPVFLLKPDGGKGMMPRKCTMDFKIVVVRREIRKLLGLKRIPAKSPVLVNCWMGISKDEAHRMKDSVVPWIVNSWPLIDKGMSRDDCYAWMRAKGFPEPPKSACKRCPYHSDAMWLQFKTEEPEEFAKVAAWEQEYQRLTKSDEVTEGIPFLHESLLPIDQVQFDPQEDHVNKFGNECEGMCGV